jgi:AbrB family looped-hinge helix DNA binding protein
MSTVKVSSKYQVVLPEQVRNALDIKPGMQVDVIFKGRIAYLVPVVDLNVLRKDFHGRLDQENLRDKKDRAA